MKVSTAQLPPGGGDDRIFTTPATVIVLDGASAFTPVPVPASAYADQLGRHLAARLDDPASDLRDVLAEAIAHTAKTLDVHPGESPSATVAILRQTGDLAECLVLGDSLIVLPGQALTDDRITRIGQPEREHYHAHLKAGHGYGPELRRLLAALQEQQAAHRNQPGGYWIAEAIPEAAQHAHLYRHPVSSVPWAVLATDGAYKTMTHLGLANWPGLRDASPGSLTQVLEHCQTWETSHDPDGRELPRAKRHDDKSIAVATLTA